MQPANNAARLTPFFARFGAWLLTAACLAVVVVFVLLGQFAHPSSDDFCMAAGVSQEGLLTHLWHHYFEWSGRYSGNAMYAVYPLLFDLFDGYRFIPPIMITALFLSAAFFLSTVFHTRLFAGPVLLVSLCFVCVYLLGMLDPASSLYWMAGALTYQSANILILASLGLMIRLSECQKQGRPCSKQLAVLLVVIVIAVGTNETAMVAITALALIGLLLHMRSGRTHLITWLVVFSTAAICFSIVYFSPGNAIRAADFPFRHDLVRAINGSLSVGSKTLWIWLSSPVLMVASVLAAFAFVRLNSLSSASVINVSGTQIALLMLCTFALPVLLQFPAWWAMGGWPPARTLDAIYFLFLLSWFATVGAIALRFSAKGDGSAAAQPVSFAMAVAVVLLALGFTLAVMKSSGMQRVKHDLFHAARPWHEYMNQRYLQIRQAVAEGRLNLAVPDYHYEYPRSLYFNDIMHNPRHWRNVCYADYFGLEKIKRDRNQDGIYRRQQE